MTQNVPVHRPTFRVTREGTIDTNTTVWGADPIDAPIATGVTGPTLAELFDEVEAVKHFILGVPKETPSRPISATSRPAGDPGIRAGDRRWCFGWVDPWWAVRRR